ncbi:MAG TPA: hypothetical protein VGG93_02420 [Candidatus Udaeobacter sp.]
MTLPSDIEFLEDVRLFIYKPRGLLDEASVTRAVKILTDLEAVLKEPFNRFSDTSAIDGVELNYQYVIHVSLYRVLSYANRPPVKSAILATDPTVGHYFQLHAIITQESPINVRIFQQRKDAAKWLGVGLERLVENSARATDEDNNQPNGSAVTE